jgi:MFS family permease
VVYRLTGSTLVVGVVTVAQFSAPVLLVPISGTVADRYDRRTVVAVAQTVGALASLVLVVTGALDRLTAAVILGVLLVLGAAQAFQAPAQLSLIPRLIPPDQRDVALSLNSAQFKLARAAGPVLAALLLEHLGPTTVFAVNTASYVTVVVAVLLVRPTRQERSRTSGSLRATFATVRSPPPVLALLLLSVVISGITDAVTTLGPALSVELTGTDTATGFLVSAFGLGAVVGALVVVPWARRFRRRLPAALLTQGLGIALLAAAWAPAVALAGAALTGIGFLVASNRSLTIVQDRIPDSELGRVMALWLVAFLGSRPLFAVLDGAVAELAGPRVAGLVLAVIVAVAAAGSLRLGRATTRARPVPGVAF